MARSTNFAQARDSYNFRFLIKSGNASSGAETNRYRYRFDVSVGKNSRFFQREVFWAYWKSTWKSPGKGIISSRFRSLTHRLRAQNESPSTIVTRVFTYYKEYFCRVASWGSNEAKTKNARDMLKPSTDYTSGNSDLQLESKEIPFNADFTVLFWERAHKLKLESVFEKQRRHILKESNHTLFSLPTGQIKPRPFPNPMSDMHRQTPYHPLLLPSTLQRTRIMKQAICAKRKQASQSELPSALLLTYQWMNWWTIKKALPRQYIEV